MMKVEMNGMDSLKRDPDQFSSTLEPFSASLDKLFKKYIPAAPSIVVRIAALSRDDFMPLLGGRLRSSLFQKGEMNSKIATSTEQIDTTIISRIQHESAFFTPISQDLP